MKDDIVIVSATRTPVGSFNGAFANLPAHELGKIAIKAAIDRAGVEGSRVTEVMRYPAATRIERSRASVTGLQETATTFLTPERAIS